MIRLRLCAISCWPVLLLTAGSANATYSIVATDSATQQVGGAVTSCVGSQGVLVVYGPAPGKGGINAQAAASATGRDRGVQLLNMGTAPDDIITQITSPSFDSQYNERQYGIADLQGRAAAFTGTGSSVATWRGSKQGTLGTYTYSIQGNVLTGGAVVDQAETAFRGGGCDLAEKMMLALEGGAQNGQGDSRCTPNGTPANAASIEVDLVGQPAGSYLKLSNAKNGSVNAVVQLRSQFNTWRQTHPCSQTDGGTSDASVDAGSKDVSTDVTSDRTDSSDVSLDGDASDGSAGSGGVAGTAGTGGTGGLGGDAGASTGGRGGTAGTTDAGGRGGSGGIVGTGGVSGAAGQGGTAGNAGSGGAGGATGTGGAAGSAGASGSTGGTSSTGGRGGTGTGGSTTGSGGSTADDGGCSCRLASRERDVRSPAIFLTAIGAAIASARSRRAKRRRGSL